MQLSEKQELVRLLGLYQNELLMENEENLKKKMRRDESPKKVVADYSYGVKAQYEQSEKNSRLVGSCGENDNGMR